MSETFEKTKTNAEKPKNNISIREKLKRGAIATSMATLATLSQATTGQANNKTIEFDLEFGGPGKTTIELPQDWPAPEVENIKIDFKEILGEFADSMGILQSIRIHIGVDGKLTFSKINGAFNDVGNQDLKILKYNSLLQSLFEQVSQYSGKSFVIKTKNGNQVTIFVESDAKVAPEIPLKLEKPLW